jgi:MFS transporter, DHA1 family, multidrug resistance protein
LNTGLAEAGRRRWSTRAFPAPESRRLFVLIGCLAASGPAAMDMYVPGLPEVSASLHSSTSATQLTIALYLVGIAAGQLVFGQVSDIFGRRRPLLIGLALFLATSVACAAASSLALLVAARFLQGVTGASGVVIGRTVVRDLYGLTASARYYSRLTLIYGLAPLIAPLIGSQVLRLTSWHGVFVFIALFGAALLAGAALWFPETLPRELRRPGAVGATLATFRRLLRTRRFVGCMLTIGLSMGALVAYVSMGTFVIQERYGASTALFAVLFAANAAAMVIGNQINAHLLHRFSPLRLAAFGLSVLIAACVGLVIVGVAGLGLAMLEICLAALLGSWGFIQGNILALGLADFAAVAGAGSALIGLSQYAIAGLVAPLAGLQGSSSVTTFAIVSLSCAVAAAACAYALVIRGRGRRAAEPLELPLPDAPI